MVRHGNNSVSSFCMDGIKPVQMWLEQYRRNSMEMGARMMSMIFLSLSIFITVLMLLETLSASEQVEHAVK